MNSKFEKMDAAWLAVFPYGDEDPKQIRKRAAAVLRDPSSVPRRNHEARDLAFHAGRAAVAALFHDLQIEAWVEPNPFFGYLNAVRADGSGFPNLFVNISHTEQIAVAAASPYPIGVDVESIYRDASRAIRRVSSDPELRAALDSRLQLHGESIPGEVALWSAKEAVSKACGLGIKFGMQDFVIGFGDTPKSPLPVSLLRQGPLKLVSPAATFTRHEHFLIALCTEEEVLRHAIRKVSIALSANLVNRE